MCRLMLVITVERLTPKLLKELVENSIEELVSNESLSSNMDWSKHPKSVLIMNEVDGMSASIKISKIPIICICNDRYSQKLKSLVNYCLLLNFRKPTKQQVLCLLDVDAE